MEPNTISIPIFSASPAYNFGVTLVAAAAINLVLAGLLLFDPNNYLYAETPRYLRSRRFTGVALAVFGCGFLLHWMFMPHFTNLLAGKALSFSYFHIGGVLFSMSHTELIDRHYFNRRVVMRDVTILAFSLVFYWGSAIFSNLYLTYLGSCLFFLHIGYLTCVFYRRFHRIYKQLGDYAEYLPNDTDKEVLWLHISCHLIIAFGIGGMLCTVAFHDATKPFTILLLVGIIVFTYIYKTLDSFGVVANEAENNLQKSEEYLQTEEGQQEIQQYRNPQLSEYDTSSLVPSGSKDEVKERIERWVAECHFTEADLTIRDALQQMGISYPTLNSYLNCYTTVRGYRQWLPYLRIEEAKRLMLLHPNYSLQTIAEACGYSNSSNLSRAFKAQEGVPPMEWLQQHIG